MPIQKGDIKLVKSEVMDDVPEGGGGPTANQVVDGASNAIFADISETDRAAGDVSAKKVHVWVQSPDTDTLLGPNVIVAEPPNDPNVSVTLFTTGEVFDRRSSAISRIEAYLNRGVAYAGYLYGDHIVGQSAIAVFQRTGDLPAIGDTLALTKRQGFSNEVVQYVRIIQAKATLRTFTDQQGDYTRYVLDLRLSDPLRQDMQGHNVSRFDPEQTALNQRTQINSVVVADAAKYYGVVPTQVAAAIGDFSVKATGIFSQLVPSAQIETIVADARTNQLLVGLQAGGAAVVRSVTTIFAPSQNLFLGGGIKAGSLSITSGGVTVTDLGGKLQAGGEQVGTVDYENGVLSLLSPVFGTSQVTLQTTYQPAEAVLAVTQSQGIPVTQATRASSYVQTIEPPPLPGTLSVAYRVADQWYVLRDEGGGALRGADSSYGAGNVNPTTGTVAVTLGALPDVGSEIILQWVEPSSAVDNEALKLDNDGKLFWPINSAGVVGEVAGPPITPGQLGLVWTVNGDQQAAGDDGKGHLTGDATGTVSYANGLIRFSPKILPPVGTPITINLESSATTPFTGAVSAGVGNFGAVNIAPGSISFSVVPALTIREGNNSFVEGPTATARQCFDDGLGKLMMETSANGRGYFTSGSATVYPSIQIGTVNYQTGDFTLQTNITLPRNSNALRAFLEFNTYAFNIARPVMNVENTLG